MVKRMTRAVLLLVLGAGAALAATRAATAAKPPTAAQRAAIASLAEKYRTFLAEVDVLLFDEERAAFLALTQDYERDAFVERFWTVREPRRRRGGAGFRDGWMANVALAREMFHDLADARSRLLLLNGPPELRVESGCPTLLVPLEAWFYPPNDRTTEMFAVVFYRKWGAGSFRIWDPADGLDALFNDVGASRPGAEEPEREGGVGSRSPSRISASPRVAGHSLEEISPLGGGGCGNDEHAKQIVAAIVMVAGKGLWPVFEQKINTAPRGPGSEWVSAFESYRTEVPPGAPALPARLEIAFPGRLGNRTMVQGVVTVPPGAAGQAKLGDARSYNLLLNGEVLYHGELLDSFRYKFDLPVTGAAPAANHPATALPLTFERPLRPGDYTLIVKVEDVDGGRFFRDERALSVPARENAAPAAPAASRPEDAEVARILAEADAALRSGETTVKLIPPAGELHSGQQRFDTLTTGPGIDRVTFVLDGKPVLTKRAPPYSVELDLGSVPRTHALVATAYDAQGSVLAGDELAVNATSNRFRVRLAEPRAGKRYEASLLARAAVEVPEGETLERVEIYLNEARIATLYQPPWVHPVVLTPEQPLAYVRAVAWLADGTSTEGVVFVNAPEEMAQVNVDFVELYTTVLDRQGHPVTSGLKAQDFTVAEDGARQTIARAEPVADVPIHAAIAIDVSASMEPSLAQAQAAALQFLQGTIRPRDRAEVITFNDHPMLAVKFTRDVQELSGGLAGLKAERGTALYDSLIFSFYTFNGLKGRRALLLLSDGRDEGSRFSFEECLEFARRAGVTVYAIGLGDDVEKRKLSRIAEETGGRAFFLKRDGDLAAIYATIAAELRAQYLIAYQSTTNRTDPGFRTVDLKVTRSGLEAKTMRGYYP
jgi:Ca-activated chloride channel family protein